jgi:hypothetical protein
VTHDQESTVPAKPDLKAAIAAAESLMDIDGVVGVGEGRKDGKDCVVVFVEVATPELLAKLPKSVKGFPVDVRDSGPFTAS